MGWLIATVGVLTTGVSTLVGWATATVGVFTVGVLTAGDSATVGWVEAAGVLELLLPVEVGFDLVTSDDKSFDGSLFFVGT